MNRKCALLLLLLVPTGAMAQSDPVSRSWNQPVEPFRIVANLYYVGASDVTAYLLTTRQGHILLDGGFEETAPQIQANVEKLGFRLRDVRILLNSHGHLDHAGGLAELRRVTGGRFLATAREIPLLARGGRDDPQFGNRFPYTPIYADGIVRDGGRVSLGGTELVAHVTAGHTPGCTSWTTTLADGSNEVDVVFLCSPTVPSEYKLVNNERYPNAIEDYRAQFRFLRSLTPDIHLASHGNFFDLTGKMNALRNGAKPNPFIDSEGYRKLIATMEQRFEAAVEKQSASPAR
jgi:metallo-beta-lactamase class B